MEVRNKIIAKFTEITNDEDESKAIENNTLTFVAKHCKEHNIPQNLRNSTYRNLYVAKSRQLYHNLKEDSYINNKNLQKLLQKKKINIEKIAEYSYKQLYPSKWKKFNKDLEILNKEISDFDKEVQASSAFTCPKCKNNKTVYSQFQTRSADEPITSYITCVHPDCNGYNWKE